MCDKILDKLNKRLQHLASSQNNEFIKLISQIEKLSCSISITDLKSCDRYQYFKKPSPLVNSIANIYASIIDILEIYKNLLKRLNELLPCDNVKVN